MWYSVSLNNVGKFSNNISLALKQQTHFRISYMETFFVITIRKFKIKIIKRWFNKYSQAYW